MAVAIVERHRLGVEVRGHFVERLVAARVAGHEYRELRRDLHVGETDLPIRVIGAGWRGDGKQGNTTAKNGHDPHHGWVSSRSLRKARRVGRVFEAHHAHGGPRRLGPPFRAHTSKITSRSTL